ncbi:MAG: DUF885 domain-containing protein [Bacteroidota bacterium]
MKFSARIFAWILALALIGYGLVYVAQLIWFQPSNVEYFFQRLMVERLGDDYEKLTSIRPPFLDNFSGYDADFSRTDTAVIGQKLRWAQSSRQTLADYPYEELTAENRLKVDILSVWLEHEATRSKHSVYYSALEPAFGAHVQLPLFLTTQHPIAEKTTAEDYLSRLKRWGQKFDQVEGFFFQQEAMGLKLSRYQLEQSIAQIEALLALESTEHPFYTTFATKASQSIAIDPTRMNERLASQYLSQVSTQVSDQVEPAYQRLLSTLQKRLATATDEGGIAALPNAQSIYAAELARYTESEEELAFWQEIAQTEFQHIAKELDSLLEVEGAGGRNRGQAYQSIAQKHLPDSTYLRSREYLKDIRSQIGQQRGLVGGLVSEFAYQPLNIRDYAPQLSKLVGFIGYTPAPLDASQAARLFINSGELAKRPTWQLGNILWTKAWPGRHLARSMTNANPTIDAFQQIVSFPAYREGWESYSGYLIEEELLLLESENLQHIGFLQYRLSQVAKAIIDAALFNGEMDVLSAQNFLQNEVGLTQLQAQKIINEVLARPAKAFSRLAGRKKLLDLRERAKQALEGRFFVQEFHDILLKNGEVPLSVLEKLTETWIQQKLAS